MKAKLLKDPKLLGANPVVGNIYNVVHTKIVNDKTYYRLRLCKGVEFSIPAEYVEVVK